MRSNITVSKRFVQSAFSEVLASYWKNGNFDLMQSQIGH